MSEGTWRVLAVVALIGQSTTIARLVFFHLVTVYRAFTIFVALYWLKTAAMLYVGFNGHLYRHVFIVTEIFVLAAFVTACLEAYGLTSKAAPIMSAKASDYLPRFIGTALLIGFAVVLFSGGSLDISRLVFSITTIRCLVIVFCSAFLLVAPRYIKRWFRAIEPGNLTRHKLIFGLFGTLQGIAITSTIVTASVNPWNLMLMVVGASAWCAWPWIFTIQGQIGHEYTEAERSELRADNAALRKFLDANRRNVRGRKP